MTACSYNNKIAVARQSRMAWSAPAAQALTRSRSRVRKWTAQEAPLKQWGQMQLEGAL
ncbi:MAG TPA: hypothetical protein VNY32_00935 [Candidatus Acidoferrales bacterium]|nr:hypothetical protein [Candidatus Acidoferrales bacterium]